MMLLTPTQMLAMGPEDAKKGNFQPMGGRV